MKLLDFLFPKKCPICGVLLKYGESEICQSCYKTLPRIREPRCARCGKPLATVEEQYCHDCEEKSKRADVLVKGTALWLYDIRMKRAMADFKYEGCVEDGAFFAKELYRFCGSDIKSWHIDAIVPVPLHRRKQQFRGYNQAAVLAEALSQYIQLPVLNGVLKRKCYTKPQKGLTPKQRARNVAGAFALGVHAKEQLVNVRRILLVDDIYTTGATLEACGRVLRRAGVQEVYFTCLCIGRDY